MLASGSSSRANKEWIPSTTHRHILTGHRDKINVVSFHPLYSVLASASVDASQDIGLGYRKVPVYSVLVSASVDASQDMELGYRRV